MVAVELVVRALKLAAASLLTVLAATAAAAPPPPASIVGVVSHVTDGDTLWVRPADKARKPLRVRLQGIDAPERCQAAGGAARRALQRRVLHRAVVVEVAGRDRYHRVIGRVLMQGEDLGAWLVRHGHAWSERQRGAATVYASEEREARAHHRGLFADHRAVEPRVFRDRQGPGGCL